MASTFTRQKLHKPFRILDAYHVTSVSQMRTDNLSFDLTAFLNLVSFLEDGSSSNLGVLQALQDSVQGSF